LFVLEHLTRQYVSRSLGSSLLFIRLTKLSAFFVEHLVRALGLIKMKRGH
jgi:hypothetical protein